MNRPSLEILKDISSFRSENKKCVSTSHSMTVGEYQNVFPLLVSQFKKFDTFVDCKANPKEPVTVRINTNL